jgi:hypothetical protein
MRTILNRTSMILYNEKVNNYKNSSNSYYIFGVDFMIKTNFDVILIEINHSPGFKHKNPNDTELEKKFLAESKFNQLPSISLYTIPKSLGPKRSKIIEIKFESGTQTLHFVLPREILRNMFKNWDPAKKLEENARNILDKESPKIVYTFF